MDCPLSKSTSAAASPMAAPGKAHSRERPEWAKARRIVVKIGSSLLVDRATGRLNACWLNALAGVPGSL